MNPFKQDIIDLFSRKRGGHIEQWLYSDTLRKAYSGSQLWHEFLKASTNYYVLKNEVELVSEITAKINTILPPIDTVVDFGVGDSAAVSNKTIPILQNLKAIKQYAGIDLSMEFLKGAKQAINKALPDINTSLVHTDFYNTLLAVPGINRLGLMLGSTITNQDMREGDTFPREPIVQRLRHLKSWIGEENHFFITYDANSDPKSIQLAYDNSFWGRHVTGAMYDVVNFAIGNFLPKAWQHVMVWNEKAHVLHQCAEATQNMNFSIDGHHFVINKGERFVTVNNFKFPTPLFQSMCKEAGFEVKDSYTDSQNRMCLQLLRA